MPRKLLLSSAAGLALAFSAGTAAAQQAAAPPAAPGADADAGLGTIIVTARRVEENLQRVPATVTVVDAEQLRRNNITAVSDLQTVTPSLSIASYFNDLNARFAVRGLTAGVTSYFAEAPCCGGVASAPFMDIASVQVLNGPQGTLFGRSSAAGAVLITPQKPELDHYGGLVDATVGDHGRMQFTGVVNIPVIADHLAIRIAANANHINGYTKQFNTSQRLDSVNNQQYRLGVEFRAGGFENTLFASYLNVDQSATGMVLAAYNPNYAFPGTAIKAAFQAEMARQAAGGDAARITYPSYDGQDAYAKVHHGSIVNITQYDAGMAGPVKIDVKNIFSYDSYTSNAAGTYDGIGGIAEEGAFANALYSTIGSNNQSGTRLVARLGPPMKTWTEELQVHADAWDGLLKFNLGGFYQKQTAPRNYEGTTNVYKLFSNPAGYSNAVGFIDHSAADEWAWYTQATLDLSKVGVHGLSLTAGYRYSWDNTTLTTLNPVKDPVTGVFSPGSTATTTRTKDKGYNYTFSVQEQFTPDFMVYGTASRAYVPGGVNSLGQAATSLPSYSPTYDAETVTSQEIGFKAQFMVGGIAARINGDIYNNNFDNITEQLTGLIGGTSVRYLANIAGAKLRGLELAGTLIFSKQWNVSFGYSYNHAKYTKWTGSDPFNIAKPGDAVCVPSSPAGLCYLDLTNNPFPYMPENQGHATIVYSPPIPESIGQMNLSATIYAQGRQYFEATAARDLQLYPGGLDGISQKPYATINLRAELKDIGESGWNAAVFINNLTDKLYASGKVPQLETLGFAAANYAPPRMAGLQVWKKF
ncbi:MAG: TonB-dependent receptor [Sphingomonas bacterium]